MSTWLIIAAYYPDSYEQFTSFAGSILGYIILAGWSVALNYHFSNGIRHLVWDTGRGLEIHNVTRSGITVLILTVVFTAIECAFGLGYINI